MMDESPSRRTVLKGLAAGLATATVGTSAASAATGDSASGWTVAETPTGKALHDVVYTDAGAFAVGGGGIVLERTETGWTKVIDGGPTGNGNDLYGADVTDDGERLWFVGASGAIGEYDVAAGVLTDHSAPNDYTNNFNAVSVTGTADEANVYIADDSGIEHYSFANGTTGTWDYTKPGSGAALTAIDFHDTRSGHVVDTNGKVFATDDGATWDVVGIADANVNFYGVDSDGPDDVWVAGGGGMVFHWTGSRWVPTDLGDKSLRDVEVVTSTAADGDAVCDGYTVGGGGAVYDLTDDVWSQDQTPTGSNLKAVARGEPTIAVGAGGTIIEGN
ncbi:hypothetical protein [Haloarchaeobius amylolyticus]|uniref:hypothetical protein n=1 Tax=Haloarchaeobius amylolyticus TaxID=1198296 RepID=UPI00226DDAEF|nr:hypothetical protein [Haloarchaeobius amylolyticus]